MFPDNNQPFSTPAPQAPQPVQQQPQQYQQPTEVQQPVYQPEQQPVQQPQYPTAQPQQQPVQSDFDAAQGQPAQLGDEQFGVPQQQPQYPQQQPNEQWQPSQFEQPNQQPQPGQLPPQYQQPQAPQAPKEDYVSNVATLEQNFDAWLDKEYPLPDIPKISEIPADDPEALEKYMQDLVGVSAKRNQIEFERREVRAAKDDFLWGEVTRKYPNLRQAPTVMNRLKQMYAGARSMGQPFTPLQVTDAYVAELNGVQQRGYQTANQQVQIRQSQPAPNAGGGQPLPASAITSQDMAGLSGNSNDVIENAADLVAKMRQNKVGGF